MTQGKTLEFENEVRGECLSSIRLIFDIYVGGYHVFFARYLPESLRIEDLGELFTMPISKLQKITEAYENYYDIRRDYETR